MVALTVVLLSAVGGWAVHRDRAPDPTGDPGAAPGIPTQIHHPSPWLPGTDGTPPGQLSTLVPGKRGGWTHYHWGMVGISATTGAYHYLDIPGCISVDGLSPDGRHVSCFAGASAEAGPEDPIVGVEIYDTTTGHLDRWSGTGAFGLNTLTWNGDDAVTFRAGGTSYLWHFGHGTPRPIVKHLTFRVGNAGDAGLYLRGHHGFFYLDPARHRRVDIVTVSSGEQLTTPAAVSPSGRRIAVTGAGQDRRWLMAGDVAAGGGTTHVTRVPAAVHSPLIVGWADDQHLMVVSLVSPTGTGAMSDPAARFALDEVDVRTGRVTQVAGLSDQQTGWGATFATSMLAEPTRDFPAPPDPLDPRLAAALAVGVLLLGTVAVLVWRRRVRP